jgi:hypothetical protein
MEDFEFWEWLKNKNNNNKEQVKELVLEMPETYQKKEKETIVNTTESVRGFAIVDFNILETNNND